jgi:hydroxyacylglutathione hydrolase
MYFQQFFLTCLAHASYMIGSEGVAVVVDPQRDVDVYLEEARQQGLQIKHIIETHLHADFVSGHRELAAGTGATIYFGAKAGAQFPHVPVRDGDTLEFGNVRLTFMETPGHTPESVCVLVTDLERSAEPVAVLTGDTLFIGSVGRPDLGGLQTPEELAGLLYDSLHTKLLTLPDSVEVYPAHGAGSLCGRAMRPERSSTIGMERNTNYALRTRSRDEFVRLMTAELPDRPEYFARDVELNRGGAPSLAELPDLPALEPDVVLAKQQAGAIVLDTRDETDFGAAHVPGALQIGLDGQYASWAGTLIGLDSDIILLAENEDRLQESRLRLTRVGIERVVGYVKDGMAGWTRAAGAVERVPQVGVLELAELLKEEPIQLVDVRRQPEWEAGSIRGAIHKPLATLQDSLSGLDKARTTAVTCKGGYRSSIATSILQRAGFRDVLNVTGGFDAWLACELPVDGHDDATGDTSGVYAKN